MLAPGVDAATPSEALGPDRVLVRYGELGLKSPKVRGRFLQRLDDAIILAFQREGLACVVEHDQGHVYVHSGDLGRAVEILTTVFGVVSVSPVATAPASDLKVLGEAVARYARPILSPGQSFAIRSRRVGKHAYTSQEAAAAAGAAVRRAFADQVRVDLGDPDVAIELEVRGDRAYVYHERMPGTGGLPPGSQGRVLCPLRTRHDAVACWLLMRRGCEAVVVTPAGDAGAAALANALRRWAPALRMREVPEGEWGWPALYRELGRTRCLAVVVGARGPEVPELPPDRGVPPVAMFPLVGLDDAALASFEERVLGPSPS